MNDIEYLIEQFDNLTDERTTISPVQWAREHRYLPEGLTPKPGPWSDKVAPFACEPLNHVSRSSDVHEIVIAKGAQTTFTVSVIENALGFSIDAEPCPMQYVTADTNLAGARMELAIDRMIDSAGLRGKIFSQSINARGKKTGDTKKQKEFPGGFLLASSIGSASSGRSFSVERLFLDEIDAAKVELGKDGDPLSVFVARTKAFTETRKIYYVSTPLEKSSSKIWPLYKQGDQRRYFVKCPFCGHMQYLEWKQIRYEEKNGRVIDGSVYYECANENCKAHWRNYHKSVLFPNKDQGGTAEWRPTAKSKRAGLVSYHISALYSPLGFESWESLAQQWVDAQNALRNGDVSKLKTFINLGLGEPWEERGEAPRYERIMAGRTNYNYHRGLVPDKVIVMDEKGQQVVQTLEPLFLTFGADVHGGEMNPRIEMEVVAWGRDARSWSYDYMIFEGATDNITDPAFTKMKEYLTRSDFITQSGKKLEFMIGFIDAGYNTQKVYDFCSTMKAVYPIQGESGQRMKSWKMPFKKFSVNTHQGMYRYDLHVDLLKDQVYSSLKLGTKDDGSYPPQFAFFPGNYPEKFFRMLCSEEKIIENDRYGNVRFKWKKIGSEARRNEFLDCRVYALAAMYAIAYEICTCNLKLDSINWPIFWDYMTHELTNSKK